MELLISTKLDAIEVIKTNFDDVKKFYLEKLDKYKGLTYGEDQIKEAKVDRASLNKEIKTLKGIITDTKRELFKPMYQLESDIKELVAIVESVNIEVDSQVKDAEEKARAKKKLLINSFFNEVNERFSDDLTITIIWQDNWMNATYKMPKVQLDITTAIGYVARDIDVIIGMGSKFEDKLKHVYFETLDLAIVMSKKNEMEEAERVVLAKQAEVVAPIEQKKEALVEKVFEKTVVKPNQFEAILRITATISQMNDLKEFMNIAKIKYEKM